MAAARAWALALLCGAPALAPGQLLDGWAVSGSNTARIERYGADGDAALGPFPHLGTTGYDELTVAGLRRPTPWSMQRFFVSALVNDSPYRAQDPGIVPERLGFLAESGESALAWRLEAGDFFAFTSLRTLQRSLKGAAVELQPAPGAAARHSVLAFAGAFQPSWRHGRWSDDNAAGASWLVDTDRHGRWNASFIRFRRGPGGTTGAADARSQSVASVAGEMSFEAGSWRLRAEGEVARFDGDHDGGFGHPAARGVRDTGAFAQLSGFGGAFHWRLRGERYGADYRPFGAIALADRRALEAHGGWNLPQGVALRARLQDYRDQWEGDNPLDTRVAGVNLSGGFAPLALSGALDAFVQDTERRDGSTDARFAQASANLSRPIGRWVAQLNASWLDHDDRLDAARAFTTTQVQAAAAIPFAFGAVSGSIAPGAMYRRTRGSGATRDWQPTLAVALFGGPHRFSANLGRLSQDPRDAALAEVATVNAAFDYRYRWGRHELGVDAVLFDRRPTPGARTEAYRIGASWTWHFEKPPAMARAAAAPVAARAQPAPVPATLPRSLVLLARIAPGHELAAAARALAASGFGNGAAEPRAQVYEARLIEEVEQRQRLVVVHAGGLVERVALLVSLDGADDPARAYERVRRALLDAFGAPAAIHDEGAWGPGFARDVAAGRFARVTEWATPSGVLRLGIPRRLDGVARIEVQHARSLGSPRDPAWGLEAVR